MTEVRRRYTKRQKVTAIVAAEMTSGLAAAQATGIPETNIRRWRDDPELAKYGEKTREELAAGSLMLAHRALEAIGKRIADFEPRDLVILWGIAIDKSQLLSGSATERIETLTSGMDDHEKAQLHEVLRKAIAEREAVA